MSEGSILRLDDIHRTFRTLGRTTRAVAGVSLDIHPGEILGIVGESGSGKSTVGRIATGLEIADAGRVLIDGQHLAALSAKDARALRRQTQMIFQDPYSSLNPRLTVGRQVEESLRAAGWHDRSAMRAEIERLFGLVQLERAQIDRYPHEFSGGQRQRVAIARALAPAPRLIVADEPVSALDVTIQSQILKLISELRQTQGTAFAFISHDISVVNYLCDRIVIMLRGRIVEFGLTRDVVSNPQHPYSQALIGSVPRLDRRRTGDIRPPTHFDAPPAGSKLRMISPTHGVIVSAAR